MTFFTFRKLIWDFYKTNRRSFPWRETSDPYTILVSEFMLQQTQTLRVVPKYLSWLHQFPTVKDLADAKLSEVLFAWSGLGYNRRAKYLWEAAKKIQKTKIKGIPDTFDELRKLPGIGEYTANALLAFAYNRPTVVLETNIRTAIIHHFFEKTKTNISDSQIKDILVEVLDKNDPRNWYYALMDYGNWLKSEGIDYFHKLKNHTKQKPFKGSERFVRGYLLRESLKIKVLKIKEVIIPGYTAKQIRKIAAGLVTEGLLKETRSGIIEVS